MWVVLSFEHNFTKSFNQYPNTSFQLNVTELVFIPIPYIGIYF